MSKEEKVCVRVLGSMISYIAGEIAKFDNEFKSKLKGLNEVIQWKIGDDIEWGAQSYGEPTSEIVYAVAYPSSERLCSNCNIKNMLALVKIIDNKIKGLEFYKFSNWVKETVLIGLDRKAKYYKETKYKEKV